MTIFGAAQLAGIIELLRPHETKIRFLLAGGINTVFGLAAFPLLLWALGRYQQHYLIVLTISQIICTIFAYGTTKFLVFRTKGQYFSEFVKFASFYLTNFVLNLVGLPLLVELGKIPPVWAQLAFALTVIITSYFWHSRVTFKSRRPRP